MAESWGVETCRSEVPEADEGFQSRTSKCSPRFLLSGCGIERLRKILISFSANVKKVFTLNVSLMLWSVFYLSMLFTEEAIEMSVFPIEGGDFLLLLWYVQLRITICTPFLPHINYWLFNLAFPSCHLFSHMEVAALPVDNRKLLTCFTLHSHNHMLLFLIITLASEAWPFVGSFECAV